MSSKVVHINSRIRALIFLPGVRPRIVSCEESAIQLHHLEDGLVGEAIESKTGVLSVAASNDGKRIVIGATDGLTIWKIDEGRPIVLKHHPIDGVRTIDISFDSKWAATGSNAWVVDVWDLSTGERRSDLGPLRHEYNVVAVKFCHCGRRLATATLFGSIRILATEPGQAEMGKKIFTIPAMVMSNISDYNVTLAWFADSKRPQLFAVSEGQIKRFDAKDGLVIYQWALRGIRDPSSVALSPNTKLIAYSLNNTVIVRDTASGGQLGEALKHDGNVSCIAFSPGSDYLVAGVDTKLTIWNLRKLLPGTSYFLETTTDYAKWCAHYTQDTVPIVPPTTWPLPLMNISNPAVKAWLHSYLDSAEEVFSKEIDDPKFVPNYDTYANRALIRGRLGKGDEALEDANKSLSIQPSAIGQIAKTIAILRQGNHELARQEIPKVLKTGHSKEHASLLQVIQSILSCLSGKYNEEVTHISELKGDQKLLFLVQANMHLSEEQFEEAMKSFKKARVPIMFPYDETPDMRSISFIFGWKFNGLGFQIQQKKCEFLLREGDSKAADLFCEVKNTYQREIATHAGLSTWALAFGKRCLEGLRDLGDEALDSGDYAKAIRHYKAVEPLIGVPDWKFALLLKRSKAYVKTGPEKWVDALRDADEAIRINPYVPWGYDMRHEALYIHQDYREAADALDKMFSYIVDSRDDKSKELREKGVKPSQARKAILEVVEDALAQARPHLLINTRSGRLCDKQKQSEAFRADPTFKNLILSPVSQISDHVEWRESVQRYFRYATFSHTWEDSGEPVFRDLDKRTVDRLTESFPHRKLQNFCTKSRDHGYWWAWSDTCCINKDDREALSASLRSMYRWYSGSSLTIVHLKGVLHQLDVDVLFRFLEQLGDSVECDWRKYRPYFEQSLADRIDCLKGDHGELEVDVKILLKTALDQLLEDFVNCRWNKRAWTLQEYFASKAIHFYTEDWKPYLPVLAHHADTKLTNHKIHRAIHRGMELVTRLDPARLAALKPGSDDAREKLRLASTRTATRKEDTAYSLLGIFKVTIETIYGDDEVPRALGRLLGALLTQSADITILAWTGDPSEYNTCLPAEITVYERPEVEHVPRSMEDAEIAASIPNMSSSLFNSAIKLHDRLLDLPPPDIHHGRLKLPCISFPLSSVVEGRNSNNYSAEASFLGTVELKGVEDLPSSRVTVLVHPWFSRLLDPGISLSDAARQKCASRLVAALRQPFGALLLVLNQSQDYRRIVTKEPIRAQIREDVTPEQLLDYSRVLYIR